MKKYLFFLGATVLLLSCQPAKQAPENNEPVTTETMAPANSTTDYLHVPGPLTYGQKEFFLSWSSHPSAQYYKHEYLPKGENPDRYDQMIMLELALGDFDPKAIAMEKANGIESRKGTDALAAYTISTDSKTGELLLDFMLSEGTGDGTIAEWNSYRYKPYVGPGGEKGITLFALSKRGYGSAVSKFAAEIASQRKQLIAAFGSVPYPEIKI